MTSCSLLDDLFRYNDWAHHRLFQLSEGLTDAALDAPYPMGFGSLRATFFHILTAEKIWLERWQKISWRPFPTSPEGMSLEEIRRQLAQIAQERRRLIDSERPTGWQRMVTYLDSKRHEYRNRLVDLLLHVANHGVNHRAQALYMLKREGRTIPGGLDYIFYRLAYPTVTQTQDAIDAMRGYGLEVATAPGSPIEWHAPMQQSYFAYHDWANQQILEHVRPLHDDAIDRDFGMGPGSIRKTLLHLHDAEVWWQRNWAEGGQPFPRSRPDLSIAELEASWQKVASNRNALVGSLTDEEVHRIVTVVTGGPPTQFEVIESLIQLCCHGTHHRAQLSNMLRQLHVTPPALDYVVWIRSTGGF